MMVEQTLILALYNIWKQYPDDMYDVLDNMQKGHDMLLCTSFSKCKDQPAFRREVELYWSCGVIGQ